LQSITVIEDHAVPWY